MTAIIDSPTTKTSRRTRKRNFTPWLGVDIGTHSVKLATVVPDANDRLTLGSVQRVLWPAGTNPFSSADHFAQALQHLLRETEVEWSQHSPRIAAFSLPACALSEQELPVSASDESAVEAEAVETIRQIYQTAPDSLAFDCWSPPQIEDAFNDDGRATLIWADPNVVGGAVTAFQKCGLQADVLDTPTLVTARASRLDSDVDPAGSELVVDWGAGGITLTWLLDGHTRFSRTSIHGGCQEVVAALADKFHLDALEGELLLSRYGLPGESRTELSVAIEACLAESLDVLHQEIDRTILFLGSRYPRHGVERCLLIGGGAALRNLPAWITRQTDLPTRVWSLPFSTTMFPASDLLPGPLFAQAAALSALAVES